MSLSDFWECSIWEFSQAVKGWNRANGGEQLEPPSEAEFEAALARIG